ncbi:Mitochondrial intermediate peptidase [Steccherinum ochraceum]|uniref:Mitochondrial intermediate peptidase n=1 Tax=Steccherinum ochraceum TaxID=92696 RepID=A0A4R0R636_9APHY|nr:Mitochondrial intermediate peptidase [Steccherinum ochraceum]
MIAKSGRDAFMKLNRPPFRFRGCLQAKKESTRHLARPAYALSTPSPASKDDTDMIASFDHPNPFFKSSPLSPSGLFNHNFLTTPNAFRALSQSTLRRAEILTRRISRARGSPHEMGQVVKNLDRLSDMLCGVIDLAELIRNAHPDPNWIQSAEEVYDYLCQFMNVLNTHLDLYEVLRAVLSDPELVKSLSPEAHETALIFWRDFEKSGVNLPVAQREKFVTLSSEILSLGRQFLVETTSARPPASIKPSELQGLKDRGMGERIRLQAKFTQRDILVYPGSLQAQMIMHSAPEEEPRRKVYMAANTSTPSQIQTLESLLHARGELARLVGKESYAHMTLGDKMAKSPENVSHFLDAILDHTRPYARRALRALSARKQGHLNTPPLPLIQAWDRDFYCPPEPPAPPVALPPLTLGTVFMGLSRLFRNLYGISLRPVDVAPGEIWHSDVRKLEVVDEETGTLGWIYADLFHRRGKPGGAAHYTVRCSRRTDDDDEGGDIQFYNESERDQETVRISKEFDFAHRTRIPGQDGVFQLPVVVLLCEFARPTASRGPTTLSWHEVLTLFHEMGHAMHSMIGRTEYQNVSGTRCATDFVELPSILMEHFLTSPTVLSLFDVDQTPVREAGNHHEDPCRSIDTHTQILFAALDQIYHSPAAFNTDFDSTTALAKLYEDRGLIPYVPGTSWQTQFGHLFGYGATYYSYLFDRAIASRVWRKLFVHDPLSRETGEKFKREILMHGGAKNPWSMVSGVLDAPELAAGDAQAMAEVGRWKIEDEVSVPGRH